MGKYRDWIIILGAVVCLVEFMTMEIQPVAEYRQAVGILHLTGSIVLLITLILYVSMWRMGWILLLRVIFAGFILFMMISSFRFGITLLSNP